MTDNHTKYHFYKVPPVLAHYVKYIWHFETLPNNADFCIFRTYANPLPTVYFIYDGNVSLAEAYSDSKMFMVGQTRKWMRFKTTNQFGIFGLSFYPFALPQIFKIPAYKITDQVTPLPQLFEGDMAQLFAEVPKRDTHLDRYQACVEMMAQEIDAPECKPTAITTLITDLIAQPAAHTNNLEDTVFMSKRNFERHFKHCSGFSPKAFINVLRFQAALNKVSFEEDSLIGTAYDLNFYDQAHFANSFKDCSGFNPKQFSKRSRQEEPIWNNFVDFFQFLSICPPVLCKGK